MPRKLDLTARQITAICKGAARAGYTPIVEIGNIKISLVPNSAVVPAQAEDQPSKRLMDYFPEVETRPSAPMKGRGGYPVIVDPSHPLKEYYDKLGFDPATMGQREMTELHDEAEAKWREEHVKTPLGSRERNALRQLAAHGVGVSVDWRQIKDCGHDTAERLSIRGFLETRPQAKYPDRIGAYVLTAAGLAAWEKIGT